MMSRSQSLIVQGSAHAIPLPDRFFHCIVTSPPYYRVRQYAGEQRVAWPAVEYAPMPGLPPIAIPAMTAALGQEATVEAYVGHLVLVYRELHRVLRDDGVAWLNLGDAHASSPQADHHADPKDRRRRAENRCRTAEVSPGNCLLVPYRAVLALQADGWIVRSPNIWHQAQTMPESIGGWSWQKHKIRTARSAPGAPGSYHASAYGSKPQGARDGRNFADHSDEFEDCPGCPACEPNGGYVLARKSWRHTQAHEYVYQLVKKMQYFADQELVREPTTGNAHSRGNGVHPKSSQADQGVKQNDSFSAAVRHTVSTRNPRSVIAPAAVRGFSGDHYAPFPSTLVAPLIRATCPTRSCPHCGAPWAPAIEKETFEVKDKDSDGKWATQDLQSSGRRMWNNTRSRRAQGLPHDNPFPTPTVVGYRPTCSCPEHEPVPGWCFDPFIGSGTLLRVGLELGVNVVGLDLAATYLDRHCLPRVGLTPTGAVDELPLFQLQFQDLGEQP